MVRTPAAGISMGYVFRSEAQLTGTKKRKMNHGTGRRKEENLTGTIYVRILYAFVMEVVPPQCQQATAPIAWITLSKELSWVPITPPDASEYDEQSWRETILPVERPGAQVRVRTLTWQPFCLRVKEEVLLTKLPAALSLY